MPEEKIFCEDCKYLKKVTSSGVLDWACTHPDNCESDWRTRCAFWLRKPEVINAKNDCSWFMKRGRWGQD